MVLFFFSVTCNRASKSRKNSVAEENDVGVRKSVADLSRYSFAELGGNEGCLFGRRISPGRAGIAFNLEVTEASVDPVVLSFLILLGHGSIGILEPDVAVDVGILGFEAI